MNRWRGLLLCLGVTAVLAALDLATKSWAFSAIGEREVVEVIPRFLNLRLAWNEGAAFSLLPGRITFFVVVSAVALVLLGYFSWAAPARASRGYQVLLGLLGGGVVGNLYDRLRFERVRDFIDVYAGWPPLAQKLSEWVGTYHWPTFNLADAYICVGAVILLFAFSGTASEEGSEAAAQPAEGVSGAGGAEAER